MTETQHVMIAVIAGVVIGAFFFGGLWWTVRQGLASRYAALWFTAGLLVRMSVTLTGFYYIGRDHWPRLLACLLGFIVARVAVMRLTGAKCQQSSASSEEVHRAS